MKPKPFNEPKTEERYDVYLTQGDKTLFSKSYKTLSGAENRVRALKAQFGHLGYGAVVKPVDEIV